LLIVLAGIGYYFCNYRQKTVETKETSEANNQPVAITTEVLASKFGWLGGGSEDKGEMIVESGGSWVRPHPGPFLWDAMQSSKTAEINFSKSDEMVENYQSNNLGILATLWPFADWDQSASVNPASCAVSDQDEFLATNDKKGRGNYLPKYRCNPIDWTAYQIWVSKVVERYDGDGTDDMPGLKMPIKYWEVMNEPDLNYLNNLSASESDRLNFYKQGPAEYAELLIKTSDPIRFSDQEAKILIAGAAGGNSRQLGFYEKVFANTGTYQAFDIGNVHCISNDQSTKDFNVSSYKTMLQKFALSSKPIWVTEAEAFYQENTKAEQNYNSTKNSTAGAITAGAERIFFTRYNFDDFRSDMSQKTAATSYPSAEKYKEIIATYK
jgi:hypothetical protein